MRLSELGSYTFPGYKLTPQEPLHDPRSGRLPWVIASGPHAVRLVKAEFYLAHFNYKEVAEDFLDTDIFANVVCNLRNYHKLNMAETVGLIVKVFNRISSVVWSPEAVKLAWELVHGFTPTLGVSDERTVAMRRAALIENEVVDLIACTSSGGRMLCEDLLATFNQWNRYLGVTKRELGVAVKAITGISSTPIHGFRYWVGFQLPSKEELVLRIKIAA